MINGDMDLRARTVRAMFRGGWLLEAQNLELEGLKAKGENSTLHTHTHTHTKVK